MIVRLVTLVVSAIAMALASTAAHAHPHVWVTVKSEIVYAADGSVTGVRHAWTFDDMYSAFALQGLESKEKDIYTREELAALAEVNVTSLKDFDYFTFAKADGKKTEFDEPKDYWLEYKDSVLTLHFVLPFKAPVKARNLNLEVFDPTYFIDFGFGDKDAVALAGAPAKCKFTASKPTDAAVDAKIKSLGEAAFGDGSNYGANFANRISIHCP